MAGRAGSADRLLAGLAALVAALLATSLVLLLAAAGLVGLGQGVIVGAGLAEISTAHRAPALRGQVSSTFFVVGYVGLARPVIGVGVAADGVGLRPAGLAVSGAVGAVVAAVLALLILRPGAAGEPAG